MLKSIKNISLNSKRLIVFCHDASIAVISYPLALAVRFNSFDTLNYGLISYWDIVLIAFIIKILIFKFMNLSKGIWRFSSTPDLIQIVKAVSIATLATALAFFFWNRLESVPRSVFVIDWFLSIFFLGGGRLSYRVWKEGTSVQKDSVITLIIGAGVAGEQLIREIKKDHNSGIIIIGILDDDHGKHSRTIHRIPVLGPISKLNSIVDKYGVENIVIAIPTANSREIRDIFESCLELNLKVKILPALKDIANGRVQISHLREVNVEDLLGRQPVSLDQEALKEMLESKVIMVTGAGGSIGSELCLQILKFSPQKIILFENCEYFIYRTEMNLREKFPNIEIIPIVGNVRERQVVKEILDKYRPNIVFHAAAYKHVPMMEHNPLEAIKTNVCGSMIVSEESLKAEVDTFIMISTDKAVNPTNVMGASKRAAEIACQSLQGKGKTNFVILRFGNVLGSAGSVIPRFMEQIKNGGPITVTHPDITRYFMSIPEATQLVIQAGAIGKGGEIFVLEMGKPVKIVKLAEDLIRLAGHIPEKDIQIKFTGLRPGEKLFEELLSDEENTVPTHHKMIRIAKAREITLQHQVLLEKLVSSELKNGQVREALENLIPEYTPLP